MGCQGLDIRGDTRARRRVESCNAENYRRARSHGRNLDEISVDASNIESCTFSEAKFGARAECLVVPPDRHPDMSHFPPIRQLSSPTPAGPDPSKSLALNGLHKRGFFATT